MSGMGIRSAPAQPGVAAGTNQLKAKLAVGQKAMRDVQSGKTRSLTTKQVEDLGWLVHYGILTPTGLQDILSGKAFSDPSDAILKDHDPTKALYRVRKSGGPPELLIAPVGKPESVDAIPQDTLNYLESAFIPEGGTPEELQQGRREMHAFIQSMTEDAPLVHGVNGITPAQIGQMPLNELNTWIMRQKQMRTEVGPAYDNTWTRAIPWIGPLIEGPIFEELESGNTIATYDEAARGMGIRPIPLPATNVAPADAIRAELAASPNATQRMQARTLRPEELQALAIAKAEAGSQQATQRQPGVRTNPAQ